MLTTSQIPLGLAIASWAISIYNGLRLLNIQTSMLYTNAQWADEHDQLKSQAEKIAYEENRRKDADPISEKTSGLYRIQTKTFYAGMILFLIWHVLEMYLNKSN